MTQRKHWLTIALVACGTLPGVYVRLTGMHLGPVPEAVIAGVGILCGAFLVLWACDAVQSDISQSLALAVVAFIGVLPEYAVDIYFTWQAGKEPDGDYAHYAIANMTGANRLIIGVAWVLVVLIVWVKSRRSVRIEEERRTELLFLAMATIYAFVVALKGALVWYDGVVFVALYVWYLGIAGKRPCAECHVEGPAELIAAMDRVPRRVWTGGMFLFAAGVIVACAEPFCEGLVGTGKLLQINEFLLVQWLAPIASEAPEFVLACMFALRGQAGLALGSLLSAKLNQWTLLVGTIPTVYGVSLGSFAHPMPLGSFQMHEILLTAAQSLLAVVMLASLRLTIAHAGLLFVLFAGQLASPLYEGRLPWPISADEIRLMFSLLYVVASVTLLVDRPRRMTRLARGLRVHAQVCELEDAPDGPVADERELDKAAGT